MQEFEFSYMTNKARATIDETNLNVNIGPVIRKEIPLESIHYFFIKEYSTYNELIIGYKKKNGKTTNLKLIHGKGGIGALELINALSQNYPEKDLRGQDPEEAMKIIKATNSQKLGFWMAFLIMVVVISIFFSPYLMHYFDTGHTDVTVEDLINNKKIGTRNVSINGIVLNAGLWEQTTSENSTSVTTENNYFPIVEEGWEDEDLIHVVLKTGFLTQDEVDSFVYNTPLFTGVIRDIWWEGLGDEQIDFFISEYNFKMADKITLIEVGGDDSDAYVLIIYAGILGVMIILFTIIWIRQKRKATF